MKKTIMNRWEKGDKPAEAPVTSVKEFERKNTFEKRTRLLLDRDFSAVAAIFHALDKASLYNDMSVRDRAVRLKRQASNALSAIYRKFRILVPVLLLVGDQAPPPRHRIVPDTSNYVGENYLERGKLSMGAALVDTFISHDMVDMYNTCEKFLQARKDGQMSSEEAAFKEKIAEKFHPFSYTGSIPLVSDVGRLSGLVEEGNAVYTKEALDQGMGEEGFEGNAFLPGLTLSKADQVLLLRLRMDMFRKYLGLEQYNNSVQSSQDRPTQEKNPDAKYFEFDKQGFLKSMFNPDEIPNPIMRPVIKYAEKIAGMVFDRKGFDSLAAHVKKFNKLPTSVYVGQLGKYKAYVGYDEAKKEEYVSYYDEWDIDPPQLKMLGIDIDKFNFPFEMYGRIYKSDVENFLSQKN